MTDSDAPAEGPRDEEPPEPDEDESVPSGEEDIDALGRNPTQRRIDERGGERFG